MEDTVRCKACGRPIRNPKWKKLGMGAKCMAKWKTMVQLKLFVGDGYEVDNKKEVVVGSETGESMGHKEE